MTFESNRSRRFFSGVLMALLLLGPMPGAHASQEQVAYEIDGQARRVQLFVPDAPSEEPRTLVVVFHGRGDDDAAFAKAVQLHRDWPEAIIAYPRGERREDSSQRGWQYRVDDQGGRDLALVDRLLSDMATRHGTRPERTHVAGFSNGGHFVLLLLAERPEAFASFTVIGTVSPEFTSSAQPKPVMYLFGRGEGREHEAAWAKTVEALARHSRAQGPLRKVMDCCQMQEPGPGGAPFVFGLYNAGHIWPFDGNQRLKAFAQSHGATISPPSPGD